MYLRHQSQVIFVAVYSFYVIKSLTASKFLCSLRKLVANLRILPDSASR